MTTPSKFKSITLGLLAILVIGTALLQDRQAFVGDLGGQPRVGRVHSVSANRLERHGVHGHRRRRQ